MNKHWIYLIVVALSILLIWLASITWNVGSINETKESDIQRQEQELKDQEKKIESQDKKIKQLNKKLESKRLKQQLASKATLQASSNPTTPLTQPNHREILAMVYQTFWPDARFATLINCESGFRPKAVGYDASHNQYNYGIFQVADSHGYSAQYLFNPVNNIKVAKLIYDNQSWYAWPVCSKQAGFL